VTCFLVQSARTTDNTCSTDESSFCHTKYENNTNQTSKQLVFTLVNKTSSSTRCCATSAWRACRTCCRGSRNATWLSRNSLSGKISLITSIQFFFYYFVYKKNLNGDKKKQRKKLLKCCIWLMKNQPSIFIL
jgi:hypothetical protein